MRSARLRVDARPAQQRRQAFRAGVPARHVGAPAPATPNLLGAGAPARHALARREQHAVRVRPTQPPARTQPRIHQPKASAPTPTPGTGATPAVRSARHATGSCATPRPSPDATDHGSRRTPRPSPRTAPLASYLVAFLVRHDLNHQVRRRRTPTRDTSDVPCPTSCRAPARPGSGTRRARSPGCSAPGRRRRWRPPQRCARRPARPTN